jgi:hypothetical protein
MVISMRGNMQVDITVGWTCDGGGEGRELVGVRGGQARATSFEDGILARWTLLVPTSPTLNGF